MCNIAYSRMTYALPPAMANYRCGSTWIGKQWYWWET